MLTAVLDGAAFAERTGTGEPDVLALHGWGRSRSDLLPVVSNANALCIDLPGFGASPEPPAAWGSADYASLLAGLVEVRPPSGGWIIVGHSFGGRVAVQLAARFPEHVTGLLLTGVPLLRGTGGGRAPVAYRLGRELHRRGLISASRMERLRQQHGSADYRAAQGVMRDTLVRLVNEDYADLLPQVRCPVEMVWGAQDTAAPLEMARRAATQMASARLTEIPGSAHLLDAALLEALRQRLAALRSRDAS